jgi:hypothetical protein
MASVDRKWIYGRICEEGRDDPHEDVRKTYPCPYGFGWKMPKEIEYG